MKKLICAATLALMAPSPALAHEEYTHSDAKSHEHGHKAKKPESAASLGPHGGHLASANSGHDLELVDKDGKLVLYTSHDDGSTDDLSDAMADLVILSDGKRKKLTLTNEDAGSLSASTDVRLTPGTIVVVTLKMPDHEVTQARIQID